MLLGESVAAAFLKSERQKSAEGQQGWQTAFEFTGFAGNRVSC
jgi:hypothetical protein